MTFTFNQTSQCQEFENRAVLKDSGETNFSEKWHPPLGMSMSRAFPFPVEVLGVIRKAVMDVPGELFD